MNLKVPTPTVFEDGTLPHQIRIIGLLREDQLQVSCACMRQEDGSHTPLASQQVFTGAEVLAVFADHIAEVTS